VEPAIENSHFCSTLSDELEKALQSEQLRLVYQPQQNLASRQLVGLEALARWTHPVYGNIEPTVFIDVAEKSGMMKRFTRWVLYQACLQNISWQKRGYKPLRVAVNVSPSNFADTGFVDDVANILKQTRLDPHLLELELTECAIFQNRATAAESMQRLSEMGVSLALDDFGSGYASMSHFKYFPINRLKLDRTFLCDLPDSRCMKGKRIVEAILMFARHMGLETVAEGVENESQRKFLQEIGCPVGQGFLLGTPMSVDELATIYRPATFFNSSWARKVPSPLSA